MESTIFRLPTGELVFAGCPVESELWQALKSESFTFCVSFISLLSTLWFLAG